MEGVKLNPYNANPGRQTIPNTPKNSRVEQLQGFADALKPRDSAQAVYVLQNINEIFADLKYSYEHTKEESKDLYVQLMVNLQIHTGKIVPLGQFETFGTNEMNKKFEEELNKYTNYILWSNPIVKQKLEHDNS